MSRYSWVAVIAILVLLAGLPMAASSAIVDQPAPPLEPSVPGRALTGPNRGDALDIALAYLQQSREKLGLSADDLADLVVTDRYTDEHNGVTHIYMRQRYAGIEIFNANVNVNVASDGSVINMGEALVPRLKESINASVPNLSAAAAVIAAADSVGLKVSVPLEQLEASASTAADRATLLGNGGISQENIPARLVYQPQADGTLRLAWNTTIYQLDGEHWWDMRVDAETGKVLDKFDLVIHDNFGPATSTPALAPAVSSTKSLIAADQPQVGGGSYTVYAAPVESPSHGSRSVVTDPANALASPYGWHDTNGASGAEFTTTQGNNVHAYTDTDNNNSPDSGSSPSGGTSLNFNAGLDLTQAPSTYRPAAVTNLFYWNNLIHDVMYQYGFNEVSGNFQENNYGRGGNGSDYVYAEAQDGGGTNNANFATPSDGNNPRMQMYVWTQTNPQRDGDFDNGIIVHEYGHGISIRLTGGPSNSGCLNNQEQGGEGWSDFFGILMTIEPGDAGTERRGVGTYALGQATTGNGIRDYPYSTNMSIDPRTYNAIKTAAVPHGVGSTWAAMLWEMTWALIDQHGFDPDLYTGTGGNNIALQLVIDGLKLQPCSPGFVDARNAILQADQLDYSGANQCLIWGAFAKRGLGYSASQGSSNNRGDGVEAFDLPPACQATLKITKSASPAQATAGQLLTYSLLVENQTTGALDNVAIIDNVPAGTTYAGGLTCAGSEFGGVVTFNPGTMAAGASQTCSFDVTVNPGPGTTSFLSDDMESGSSKWSATQGSGSNNWSLGTANAHSPSHAWFAQDVSGISDQYLATANAVVLSGSPVLSFWHSYATEANYDGGVVEISVNGGSSWTDLGSLITQNGYNSTISSSYSSPIGGRQAFSGSSGGYVETLVDLSSYVGQSVQIRFRMATDSSVASTGWYVDDVTISDEVSVSNTACVSATGGQNDCDSVTTLVLTDNSGPMPTPTPTGTATPIATPTPTATPTSMVTPTATGTAISTATATPTASPTPMNTPISTPATPTNPGIVLYVSSTTNGNVGFGFTDEDILLFDPATNAWSLFFDGSDVGLGSSSSQDIDAFRVNEDGTILLSIVGASSIPNLGTIDDSDIVRFVPTSLGANTTGYFELYFDGSDVGLSTNGEDVDAISLLPDGRLIVSTLGSFSVPGGVSGQDEDLIAFTLDSLGANTIGTWELYFDGSDVALADSGGEDVSAASVDGVSGYVYLSTVGSFSVPGLTGTTSDIFVCRPDSLGDNTTCTYDPGLYFQGAAHNFGGEVIDGISLAPAGLLGNRFFDANAVNDSAEKQFTFDDVDDSLQPDDDLEANQLYLPVTQR